MTKSRPLMCFDMDGTIIDSTDAHIAAYRTSFKKNNIPFPGRNKLIAEFGKGVESIIKKFTPKASPRKRKIILKDHLEAHKKHSNLVKTIPHTEKALKKLKPHFKLGVLSNCHHDEILELLEYAKFPVKIFDVIIGEDDAKPKPSPAEILLAEKLTKADAKYMVGDTVFDIRAGKRANCKTIAVTTGVDTFEEIMSAKPDIVASSVAILPDILLNK